MGKGIKMINVLFFFVIALFIIGYGIYQTVGVVRGPVIQIDYPISGSTVNIPVVEMKGVIKNASFATLNGKQMFTDEDGNFTHEILLSEGYNLMQIEVKGRFGRMAKENLEVVYIKQ